MVWRRYVDDIFGIFHGPLQELELFHNWINSLHTKIKFSIEIEKQNTLSFLDLQMSVHQNKISYNIHRKPTTTDLLIPFNSAAPLSHKLASFRFFFNRLFNIPLSSTNFQSELNTIFYLAKTNNYPHNIINNLYNKIKNKYNSPNTALLPIITTHTFFQLPYLPHISQKIATLLRNQCPHIYISFSTSHLKLKSVISHLKDHIDPLLQHGIYRLNCPCGCFYIGRTIRNFHLRTKEHLNQGFNHLKRGTHINSAFANHLIDSGHILTIDRLNFKPILLHKGGKINFLNSMEAYHILRCKQNNENIVNNITEFKSNQFLSAVLANDKNFSAQ